MAYINPNKPTPEELKQAIKEAQENPGVPVLEALAERYQVSVRTITDWRRKAGIPCLRRQKRRKRPTKEKFLEALEDVVGEYNTADLLAEQFQVSRDTIIRWNKYFGLSPFKDSGWFNTRTLDRDDVLWIRKLSKEGLSAQEIAPKFETSVEQVKKILAFFERMEAVKNANANTCKPT